MPTTKPTDNIRAKVAALELLRDVKLAMTTRDQAVQVCARKTPPQPPVASACTTTAH